MRSNPAGREAFEYVPSMFAAPGRELTEGVHIPVRMYAVAWREIACAGGCDVWVLDTSRSPPLVPGGQAQGALITTPPSMSPDLAAPSSQGVGSPPTTLKLGTSTLLCTHPL